MNDNFRLIKTGRELERAIMDNNLYFKTTDNPEIRKHQISGNSEVKTMYIGSLMNEGRYCTHYYRVEPKYKQIESLDEFVSKTKSGNIYIKTNDDYARFAFRANIWDVKHPISMMEEIKDEIDQGEYYYRVDGE